MKQATTALAMLGALAAGIRTAAAPADLDLTGTVLDAGVQPITQSIETATFLTDVQKRDIFYDNAARFLRLNEHETARDRKNGHHWVDTERAGPAADRVPRL